MKVPNPSDVCGAWILINAAMTTWAQKVEFTQEKIEDLKLMGPVKTRSQGTRKKNLSIEQLEMDLENAQGTLGGWRNINAKIMGQPVLANKLRNELGFLNQALSLTSEADWRKAAEEWGGDLASLTEEVRFIRSQLTRLNCENYGALARAVDRISVALDGGPEKVIDIVMKAEDEKATFFETYDLPTKSTFRQLEETAQARDDEANGLFGGEDLIPKRRTDLTWYDEQNAKTAVDDDDDTPFDAAKTFVGSKKFLQNTPGIGRAAPESVDFAETKFVNEEKARINDLLDNEKKKDGADLSDEEMQTEMADLLAEVEKRLSEEFAGEIPNYANEWQGSNN